MIFLRSVFLFFMAMMMAIPAMAQTAPRADFRNFIWGASPQDVRQFESAVFYKEENGSLFFLEQPDEFRRLIRYDFADGKLWRARYEFVEFNIPDSAAVLDKLADFQASLEKQYGKPTKEQMIWGNRLYRDYPQFWARSLLSGDLKFHTEWVFGSTRVILECFHGDLFFQLYYTAEKVDAGGKDKSRNILKLP